jgi:Asp-tRNA(Asn)/Glu-tRNA(Gln) amidotransferase A subunit family amidase
MEASTAKYAAAAVIGVAVIAKVKSWIAEYVMDKVAQEKRRARDEKSEAAVVPEVDPRIAAQILTLRVSELAWAIKQRRFTCVEVMATYAQRVRSVARRYNLTADEMLQEALDAAKAADIKLAEDPDSCGPLHGVPFSVKDRFPIKGTDSTLGLAAFCNSPLEKDAVVVKAMRLAGAIPFAKSNLPQMMGWIEVDNAIFGCA